jgi:hypothetical protein
MCTSWRARGCGGWRERDEGRGETAKCAVVWEEGLAAIPSGTPYLAQWNRRKCDDCGFLEVWTVPRRDFLRMRRRPGIYRMQDSAKALQFFFAARLAACRARSR